MCGIAGFYLKDKKAGTQEGAEAFANELLKKIEVRGRHATGFCSIGWDGSIKLDKGDKPASEWIKERDSFQDDVQCVLLHTRFATQGKPEIMGNNHPVSDGKTCFAVHNGHIYNDDELFKDNELDRHFEVDSEVIPAMLSGCGWDNTTDIKEVLESFQGAMAMAAVDPVKHPTRLLLAKGMDSPLYIFETKKVIVWASLHHAIKEAWGSVLGTPPRGDKIKNQSAGVFLVAEKYGDLKEYSFTPQARPKPVHVPAPNRRVLGGPKNPTRPWEDGPFESQGEFLAAVSKLRASGEAKCRIWAKRATYDDVKDFTDVKGTLKWFNCICTHSVLSEDMTTHLRYGAICKDCYRVIMDKVTSKYTAKESGVKSRFDIHIPQLLPADKRNLENWAAVESRVHIYTLAEMAEETGYTVDAIDFLLFRTVSSYSEYGASTYQLKTNLRKMYDKMQAEVHETYGAEIVAEVEDELRGGDRQPITVERAQELADLYWNDWTASAVRARGDTDWQVMYTCNIHGEEFHFGDVCNDCAAGDPYVDEYTRHDEEVTVCEVIDGEECASQSTALMLRDEPIVQCSECGNYVLDNLPCPICRNREKEAEREGATEITVKACCCKATRDRKCRNKLKYIIDGSFFPEQKGWCNRHFTKCGEGKCGADAIFTGLDGKRYCHKHSRSKQGMADAAVAREGATIMEVR